MMGTLKCVFSVASAILLRVAVAGDDPWLGEYEYDAYHGNTYGGSPIAIEYALTITQTTGQRTALLVMQGFQTDDAIVCDVAVDRNKATILFKSYGDGNITNKYGVAVYNPGQPLLELELIETSGTKSLITHWLGLTSSDGNRPKPGVYFRKIK